MNKEPQALRTSLGQLREINQRLHHLLGLRAALAPFHATLQVLENRIQEPEGRRQLLTLWRPCQEKFDHLSDILPESTDWAVRMDILRREMESHLLDEIYSPASLIDLSNALNQSCEILLLALDQDLHKAVTKLETLLDQEPGDS